MWSQLVTDFNTDEETANFGTRLAVESKAGLYEVVTLALLEPTEPVAKSPSLICQTHPSSVLALGLDSCLHIIADNDSTNSVEDISSFSVVFADRIDALTWSPCRRFVFAGLRSGQMQILHVPSKRPLPAIAVAQNPSPNQVFFIGAHFGNMGMAFNLISVHGYEFAIKAVDLDTFHQALESKDLEQIKTIQSAMQVSSQCISDHPLVSTCGVNGSENVYVALEHELSRLESGQINHHLPFGQDQKPVLIKTNADGSLLFCLTDSGELVLVCGLTMLKIDAFQELHGKVLGFSLLAEEGQTERFQILMTVSRDDCFFLQMRDFPSFELVYEIETNAFCFPLESGSQQETPMFIEGSMSDDDQTIIKSLRIRGICESVLEERLRRLIRRHRYSEAETFAKKYKLALEEVWKGKAQWLIEKLSPWKGSTNADDMEQDFEELKATLQKMSDVDFMVQCCIFATLPTLKHLMIILKLARDIIRSNVDKQVAPSLLVQVSTTLQRLETFSQAFDDSDQLINQWISFSNCSLLNECLQLLKSDQVKSAQTIWRRHQPQISKEITVDSVQDMLMAIPASWNVEQRLDWLHQFLPDVLEMLPEALPCIAKWAYLSTVAFEVSHKKLWPANGLAYAQGVMNSLTFTTKTDLETFSTAQVILNQQREDSQSDLSAFVNLIAALKDLEVLHDKYCLKVRLADFLNEDKFEVVSLILDWCTEPCEVVRVIEEFILPSPWSMDMDKCMSEYVNQLIQNSNFHWYCSVEEAPWEKKAKAVLTFIKSPEAKANVILNIVNSAPVPWSQTVTELCQEGCQLKDPIAKMIAEQGVLVDLKQTLRKYGCKDLIVRGVQLERLVEYMCKEKGEEGFRDALEVVKVTELSPIMPYYAYIIELVMFNDLSDTAINVFEGFIQEQDDKLVATLTEYIVGRLDCIYCISKKPLPEAAIVFLTSLERLLDQRKRKDILEDVADLKARSAVAREFGIFVPAGFTPDQARTMVSNLIHQSVVTHHQDANRVYKGVTRLCQLLQCSVTFGMGELIQVLVRQGQLSQAAAVAKSLSGDQRSADQTLSLIDTINQAIIEVDRFDLDLCQAALRLAQECLAFCQGSRLTRVSTVYQWQNLLLQIGRQFPGPQFSSEASNDSIERSIFGPCFRDRGLPLDPRLFLPPLRVLFERLHRPNQSTVQSAWEVIQHLQSGSHTMLALSFTQALRDLWLKHKGSFDLPDMEQHCSNTVDLLATVLGEKSPDLDLALGHLMSASSPKQSLALMTELYPKIDDDPAKLEKFSLLGIMYCLKHNILPAKKTFESILLKTAWACEVSKHGVPLREAQVPDGASELKAILDQLLSKKTFSVSNIERFCRAFAIPLEDAMTTFMKTNLMSLEPTVVAKKVVIPDTLDDTLNAVRTAAGYIEDRQLLQTLYLSVFKEMNPYNYEVIGFILDQLSITDQDDTVNRRDHMEMVNRASQVLGFCSHYERVGEPSEKEKDLWRELRSRPVPQIARYRIPVSWLVRNMSPKNRFKLLKPEFRLDNFSVWHRLADTLGLCPDNICVQAVQNAWEQHKDRDCDVADDDNEWSFSYHKKALLLDIQYCISQVENASKAVACMYWLISKLPGGVDKVLAAEFACELAKSQRETEEEEQAFNLCQATVVKLRIQNALHKNKLATEKYLDMVNGDKTTEELVEELFNDESIIARASQAGGNYPDIHATVDEIAEATDLDFLANKFNLLLKWLPEVSSTTVAEADETMSYFSLTSRASRAKQPNVAIINANNLFRCMYLAQPCQPDILRYLFNVGTNDPKSSSFSLRALKCLLSVASAQTIEAVLDADVEDIKHRVRTLEFVIRLQKLNLPYDFESFSNTDAACLVEGVLRSCNDSKDGIELVIEICIHFGLFEFQLWTSLLQRLVALSMVTTLELTLKELNHQPHLWHSPSFLKAWEYLIHHTLANPQDEDRANKVIQFISKCPIVNELNLDMFRGECQRLGLAAAAAEIEENFMSTHS